MGGLGFSPLLSYRIFQISTAGSPGQETGERESLETASPASEALLLPHSKVLAGKLRPAVVPTAFLLRSHPISTLPDSVFPAPVSLFRDL